MMKDKHKIESVMHTHAHTDMRIGCVSCAVTLLNIIIVKWKSSW